MKLSNIIKCFTLGSMTALYLLTIIEFIISATQNYRYCVVNNVYGEFWIELVSLLFFGAFAVVWMSRTLVREEG